MAKRTTCFDATLNAVVSAHCEPRRTREANIIAITDRKTGNVTWRLGPNYNGNEAESKTG